MEVISTFIFQLASLVGLAWKFMDDPNHISSLNSFAKTIDYDEQLAVMNYSKMSYCGVRQIENWYCGSDCSYHPSVTEIQVFTNDEFKTLGWCGFNPQRDEIIIGFRGTNHIQNYKVNVNILHFPYEFCKDCFVHTGFYTAYFTLQNKITACVKNLVDFHPSSSIIVTGHSLGGAMAVLQAAHLFQQGLQRNNSIKLVTFGSPRVGNQNFANYMNTIIQKQARIIWKDDIVPHTPWEDIGFVHSGPEIWYDSESSKSKICPVSSQGNESYNCSNGQLPFNYNNDDHLNYFGQSNRCSG